jgi:serine/threonine protein kinase
VRRAPTSPPDIPGLTFLRALGSGGFSDVYLYEQELPRREVAVKVLAAETVDDQTRAAFVGEANLMAQLSAHPYIVTIYGASVAADGRPYFMMEYCAGPSLAEQYKDHRFTVADALRTGVRLSSAVATAHSAGILHRDIKPANVLTNAYGWPALTDFGISAALEPDHAHAGLTAGGGAAPAGEPDGGTSPTIGMSIPWSPPEMFADHPQTDVRSDVFSLAATIYTLLAGHTPFEVRGKPNGMIDLIGRIERGAMTPLENVRPDVPRSLLLVLARGMAVAKESRYDSVLEFARALQRVELELSFSPTTIDVPNLAVPASGDDASTIVGGVRSPARSVAPAAAPPGQPVDDSTVHGPRRSTVRARRRWVPAAVIGVVVVLVAGGVTAGILLGGTGEREPLASPSADTDPLAVEGVPQPQEGDVSVAGDGSSVTFTWTNPDAEDGDRYIWQRSDGVAGDKTPTSEASATIDGVRLDRALRPPVTRTLGDVYDVTNPRIEFCGEWYDVAPDEPFYIGRDADLVIDENPFLHRRFLAVSRENGLWWLANVGTLLSATVSDDSGQVQAWLAPSARLPIVFPTLNVLFSAGSTTYDFTIHSGSDYFATSQLTSASTGETTVGPITLTTSQRLLVVALAEDILRQNSPGRGEIPASADAAARLGWTQTAFNRKLDNVCDKLDRHGVQGLRGGRGKLATNRRARLVEYAVSTRLVNADDLILLERNAADAEAAALSTGETTADDAETTGPLSS